MGLKEGIVNKAFPGLVPTYEVMLADRYYDLNDKQKDKIFNGDVEYYELTLEDGRVVLTKDPYEVGEVYTN